MIQSPMHFCKETVMRIALTLMLLFVATLTATADQGFRGRWRNAPLRNLRVLNGNNTWQPGYDSSYYSPYSSNNTTEHGATSPTPTPTPANAQWQSENSIPNTIPNTIWTDGNSTTPTRTTNPANTTAPTTTQYFNPIPNVNSDIIRPNTTPTNVTPNGIPGQTTQNNTRRPSTSASFQLQTPQSTYWNTLNNATK